MSNPEDFIAETCPEALLQDVCKALRADCEAFRKDAARYRYAKAHGWPMSGPQCIAWTHEGQMVFGDTPEAALDAAMRGL